jgi:hypothetical protein
MYPRPGCSRTNDPPGEQVRAPRPPGTDSQVIAPRANGIRGRRRSGGTPEVAIAFAARFMQPCLGTTETAQSKIHRPHEGGPLHLASPSGGTGTAIAGPAGRPRRCVETGPRLKGRAFHSAKAPGTDVVDHGGQMNGSGTSDTDPSFGRPAPHGDWNGGALARCPRVGGPGDGGGSGGDGPGPGARASAARTGCGRCEDHGLMRCAR